MKNKIALFCALILAGTARGQEKVWNFDGDKPGEIASGFSNEQGKWVVAVDESSPARHKVLAQAAANEKNVFNLALVKGASFKNVDLSVKMKAVAGTIDQGGGLVWRAKDAKNYYVTRYNPLEENFRVDKVENGVRTRFENVPLKAEAGWHTLRAVMVGDHIECYFDGKKLLDVKDAAFQAAGQIGLWTKADAQTQFDEFKAKDN